MLAPDVMKALRSFLIPVFLIVGIMPMPVAAGPLEDAQWLISQGRYEEAVESVRPLAENNDAEAQFLMGMILGDPQSPLIDGNQAVDWMLKAANQGHIGAHMHLGYFYALGLHVPQDLERAMQYDRIAADGGSVSAMNNLAYHLAIKGGDDNMVEAMRWIDRALDYEPDESTFLDTKGWILYLSGRPGEALPWLCRSIRQDGGHPEAVAHLGDALWRSGWTPEAHQQWTMARDMLAERTRLSKVGRDYVSGAAARKLAMELAVRTKEARSVLGDPPATPLADLPAECAPPTS